MNKDVIIIGASGHGKVVADVITRSGDRVVGFLDDNNELPEKIIGIPVLGHVSEYAKYPNAEFIVAIGNDHIREKIVNLCTGATWYTAIHPTAVISPMETSFGEGTVVMANAVVNPCAKIGKHCVVNTGAILEHDTRVGDYSHISVGTKVAGTVSIGKHVWVGVGATISNNVTICDDVIIGAGAVVVRNISEKGTYVGVPARKIK